MRDVGELQGLSLEVDRRFGQRLHGRIERRALAGEFVGLAWTAPALMLLEFALLPFALLSGKRRGRNS